MEIVKLDDARRHGLVRYYTGKLCKRGHDSERYTKTGRCVQCKLDEWRRDYDSKNFYETHKDYYKQYQQVNRDTINVTQFNYRKTNKGKRVTLLNGIRIRSKKLGLICDLTLDDIIIPTHCPVLSIPIMLDGEREHLPSVDRIDNTKGYTKDNICVISMRANRLKSDSSIRELELLLDYMKQGVIEPL